MTLQQLLYVLTVSDEKTMNKAAEKLFVSQPTLTSAIQSLEKELNIQIFNRTSPLPIIVSSPFDVLHAKHDPLSLSQVLLDFQTILVP